MAAMEGIKAHGHGWMHRIYLGDWPEKIGALNSRAADGKDVDDKEVEKIAMVIVETVRNYVARWEWAQATDLEKRADELEMLADCGLDEVNHALDELYDSFDYWRILVQR
jgi:hypothetical protein